MISIYKIKPAFQKLLMPALKQLHKAGITANQITLASIVLSFGIGLCFWQADKHPLLFWALPIGLLLRMALNALDGMMARTYQQQSKKGELLNELGDVISDMFIYFPFIKFEYTNIYLVVLFICLAVINEFTGLLGKVITGIRRYEGPMGKSDRAFILGIYGILSYYQFTNPVFSMWLLIGMNFLVVISTVIRIKNMLLSHE